MITITEEPRRQDKQWIHTSIRLASGDSENLQKIATQFGYLQTRGVGAGKVGSISSLIRAIANGEIELQLR